MSDDPQETPPAAPIGATVTTANSAAPAPTPVSSPGSGLVFDLEWDQSVSGAPAGFVSDVIAAAQYLVSQISNAVTIDVAVGYDEIGGNPLEAKDLGESQANYVTVSYGSLVTALMTSASTDATDQSVLASLPATNPANGIYEITSAQAKALGLKPANAPASDGDVGFAPASMFSYGLTNTAGTVAAGTYDMFATAAHELTEVMGRVLLTGSFDVSLPGSLTYSLLDLLHYSAAGTRDFSASTAGYFSDNGGATNLGEFNTVSSEDAGDWASSVTADAFDAFGTPGVLHSVTANDLTEMDAIGWNLAGSTAPPNRTLDWTGVADSNFANPLNWNDVTDGLDTAMTAPGTLDVATIANGGSITGTGSPWKLSLSGTNTLAGTLAAATALDETGTLTVTGSLTAGNANVSGQLFAASGGRATIRQAISLAPGSVLEVDATSSIEVGTTAGGSAGDITVDSGSGGISGDGTLTATVINNGTIDAANGVAGSNTLEITGAVSGSGTISIASGSMSASSVITPGAVLRLDGAVATSQTIAFTDNGIESEAATLLLSDPTAFAGTIANFGAPDDTLVLAGQALTGVSVSGFTMTVTRDQGAPLLFNIGDVPKPTSALYVNGSSIVVLPLRSFDWTGASDGNFANALNWNDTTDGVDPAVTAPGTLDSATVTNAGTISGSGTLYQLNFGGTNTVAGALSAIGSLAEESGGVAVTGMLTASDGLTLDSAMSVSGTVTATNIDLYQTGALSAVAGGRVVSDGALSLSLSGLDVFDGPQPGVISVDSLSSIEIGTANTATAGAITVDATGSISGDGTLAAPVVNNGTISAGGGGFSIGGNTLEITGAVTGSGSLVLESGLVNPFGGFSGSGAMLRLDSSVASSQTVAFAAAGGTAAAPTLILADPPGFAGVLSAFDDAGDTLELTGETVAAAAINGSVLTVSVAGGSPLTFDLRQTPVGTTLGVSGDEVTVREQPRTLVWLDSEYVVDPGAFTSAANWNDPGDGLDPAASPPDALDLAEFTSGGGSITGTGTVADLLFAGSTQWQIGTGTTLNSVGTAGAKIGAGLAGSLELSGGGAIVSQGSTDVVSGSSVLAASLTVSGAASTWTSGGQLTIGRNGVGDLMIQAGGTVTAGTGLAIANTATADGSAVDLIGTSSRLTVNGLLDVGAGGSGVLSIESGAVVSAATLDAATSASADAQIDLSGAGTELTVNGAATVADDGTGVMSVLSGATFSADSLTIGALADSSGALVVSGAGSALDIAGQLNIGTASGTGDLTVGPGAVVDASVVNLLGGVVLEGGVLDPTVYIENGGSTTGGFGTIASDFILLEGTILSNGSKAGKQTEVVQGTVVGGGTADINGSVSVNGPGILQIGTQDTIELTGAVLNAATTTFTDNLTPAGTYSVNDSVIDVVFQDRTGVLRLDDIAGFAGTVATWHAGASFVVTGGTLSNLAVINGDTLTANDSGMGAGPGGVDTIIFGSAIDADGFSIVNNNTIVACFAEGTRIQTENGRIAVEDLTVGDSVVTPATGATGRPFARSEPIVWIGQRTVNCRAHPRPETVWPIRVRAGAFGEHVPRRDLYLSPDHAVFINNVLVPIRLLTNGTTVAQLCNDRVRYFHVELPRHAVIFAEGLTVESYLDTGDRANFQAAAETTRLFPNFAARASRIARLWETHGVARLVLSGPDLETARRTVARHAAGHSCQAIRLSASGCQG